MGNDTTEVTLVSENMLCGCGHSRCVHIQGPSGAVYGGKVVNRTGNIRLDFMVEVKLALERYDCIRFYHYVCD